LTDGGAGGAKLDKRLASDLIGAAPTSFLDNVNSSILRSDLLASVLTERLARVRLLDRSQMVLLNATAFIAVTGKARCTLRRPGASAVWIWLPCHDRTTPGRAARRSSHHPALGTAECRADLKAGQPLGSFEQWGEGAQGQLRHSLSELIQPLHTY
jgi:hypothetical protein